VRVLTTVRGSTCISERPPLANGRGIG
jgi:hypothetical protein